MHILNATTSPLKQSLAKLQTDPKRWEYLLSYYIAFPIETILEIAKEASNNAKALEKMAKDDADKAILSTHRKKPRGG